MMSKNVQIRKNAIRSYSRNLKAGQKLTNNHGIIYDIFLGSRRKVGEISAGVGKTPEQAIEDRYGSGSNRDEAIIVHRLHIFDKDTVRKSFAVNKRGFDKTLHDRINFYNAANKIKVPFFVDTLADGVSYDGNTNNEALIGFDKKHQKKLDMLVAEFLDPNKTKNHAQSLKEEIVPRGYQANTLTKAIRVLLDEHICLFHCFPGWGKSTIGLYAIVDLAHQTKNINKNKACNIAVYSPIIDTLEGFVESAIANNYFNTKINVYTTDDILTLEKEGVNLKKRFNSAKGGINLFVLSVQGVRFADPENSEIDKTFTARTVRKRYAFLNEIDLFAQIRDERHKEYGGEITSEVFENIKSEYCLDLTATPYGLLQNQEYTEEQIVCDSMLHALREKKRGNKFYADFPEISIKAIGPAQMVRENKEFCGLYTDEEDWDPRKFLDHDGKNFKLEAAIIDFLDKTIGRQGLLPKSKNPMTIINDDISPLSKKTIMLVVPEGTGGRGVKDNVPALVELVNNSPQVASRYHAVSSYELTKNRKIKPKVAIEKLREKHGKDILVITHRKMTTGSDVPPMGAIIMLDKMANPGEFEQLLGRIFRSYDGKESTRIYVFCPGMNISHVVCSMAKDAAKYDDDPEKAETEIFDCLPITLVDDLQTSIVSYDEAYRGVLEETKRLMSGDYYTQSFFDKFPLVHDAIKGLEFIPLKKGPKGTAISPKNKSKISSRKPKTKAEEKKEKKERKLWKETLTVMLNEVPMIGYSSGSVTVEDIFETELANALFGLENCQVMLHALAYGGDFSRAINISYTEMIDTINDLDDEEVFNKIYRNEQYKTDQGLVYTPMALARELLSHRNIRRLYEKCLQNGKEFAIIVPNALSGAIPLVARELYPEAKITCAEYFPYYIDHLESLGFKVDDLEENIENFNMNKKFDVVIGNPPYQDAGGNNTIYPKFYKTGMGCLKDNGILAFITPPAIIPGIWGVKNVDSIIMPDPKKILFLKTGECVKRYFPGVGSDFCYFFIKNTDSDNTSVTVETDNGQATTSSPLVVTAATKKAKIAQSIVNKCFKFGADPYQVSTSDHGRSATANLIGSDLAVEAISTKGVLSTRKIEYIREERHPHYNKPKVIMPLYGKTAVIDYSHRLVSAAQEKMKDGSKLKGHNIATAITESDSESENFVWLVESDLQKVFNLFTGETRSPYMNFLKNFKGVPLNKRMTNKALYDHFGLTKTERKYIENAVK